MALDQSFGTPTVSHDGVTVAKEIDLEDPFENMGAQLLKEAATKTNDVAGDGTTTATVIAQTIVNEGLRNLAAGANPMILKRGLARGVESVVQAVRDMAVAVQGREGHRQHRRYLRERPGDRPADRRRDGSRRQGRVITVEEIAWSPVRD